MCKSQQQVQLDTQIYMYKSMQLTLSITAYHNESI